MMRGLVPPDRLLSVFTGAPSITPISRPFFPTSLNSMSLASFISMVLLSLPSCLQWQFRFEVAYLCPFGTSMLRFVWKYLAELLAERQKLAPFVQVLPFCTRLLNQEILRASSMAPNHNFVDSERIEHGSPLRLPGHSVNGQPMDPEGWSGMQTKVFHIQAIIDIF
ncbi:hypothetical protein PR202_ga08816 [Eleusine coracana subsp. coracana]|uniref:STAR protein homodimerisation region domain-containing protein n=1 Tax=Eleusine coracana subsp. coracana TaxID=191504 RepID=A0AAV5C396_ELECO|nr:hypothetical protein PR202_ga08816 [Eleusine coracana subsp. coracana]